MQPVVWQPGSIIAGRYRLLSLLGHGSMGEVWQAEHLVLRAPIAIKLIHREHVTAEGGLDLELCTRFFREAQTAATLRSPHVVQVHDHGVHEGVPYITMELLEGETLEQRLTRAGRLTGAETVRIVTHVARALGRAHDVHIVHRDLKPANIFLVRNDDEEIAKVLDFGIAKLPNALTGGALSTNKGGLLGTPCYMSPEQALGERPVDWRSDLWALGVIAFECICGKRPFEAAAIGEIIVQICARPLPVPSRVAAVPDGFDAWWARAVDRDPERRFQSAKELLEALKQATGAEPTGDAKTARSSSTSDAAIAPARTTARIVDATHRGVTTAVTTRRSRGVSALYAVLGLLALAGGIAMALFSSGHLHAPSGAAVAPTPDDVAKEPAAAPAPSAAPSTTAVVAPAPTGEVTAPVASSAASASAAASAPPPKAGGHAHRTTSPSSKPTSTPSSPSGEDRIGF